MSETGFQPSFSLSICFLDHPRSLVGSSGTKTMRLSTVRQLFNTYFFALPWKHAVCSIIDVSQIRLHGFQAAGLAISPCCTLILTDYTVIRSEK